MDRVHYRAENLTYHCLMGILPHERLMPQPVVVDVSLAWVRLPHGAWPEGLAALDANLENMVGHVLREGRFLLVETAIHALGLVLARALRTQAPHVDELQLTITKSLALGALGAPVLQWRQDLSQCRPTIGSVIFDSPEVKISWENPALGTETLHVVAK